MAICDDVKKKNLAACPVCTVLNPRSAFGKETCITVSHRTAVLVGVPAVRGFKFSMTQKNWMMCQLGDLPVGGYASLGIGS